MILALIVFASMLPMDMAAAAKVNYLDQNREWRAGVCELIADWGGALSYGIGGAALLRYRLSLTTVVIFCALGTASIIGTVVGHKLTHRSVT